MQTKLKNGAMRNFAEAVCCCAIAVALAGCTAMPETATQENVSTQQRVAVAENVVVSYFWDVEVQFETPEQGYEICRALRDMATLSASELSARRYADYAGRKAQWSIIDMLQAYFVPATSVSLAHFFADIEHVQAREVVRQTLVDIQEICPAGFLAEPLANW